MLLSALPAVPPDPILGLAAAFDADPSPDKVDLGIGIYKDEDGRAGVLSSVKQAEGWLQQHQQTKAYLSPEGDPAFNTAMQELLFGAHSAVIADGRVRTVQTAGGSGGLRVAAELIGRAKGRTTVWLPRPTWANHAAILRAGGLLVREYHYYDPAAHRFLYEEMTADLGEVDAGDIVLLHGCCHNPSGADPSAAQWRELVELIARTQAIPFIDIAYQGFGSGIEADAQPIRLFCEAVPEMFVVSSCSKSFALYRERTGTISVVGADPKTTSTAHGHAMQVARTLYSMPPDHGAAVVAHILRSRELRELWSRELESMRRRIASMREEFAIALGTAVGEDFGYLVAQKGMFSFLDVSPQEVRRLRTEYHVHLIESGRINVAALTASNVQRVASAIASVLRERRTVGR